MKTQTSTPSIYSSFNPKSAVLKTALNGFEFPDAQQEPLKPPDFHTGEELGATPPILQSLSPCHGGSQTFICVPASAGCPTFVIPESNKMNGQEEFLSYVIEPKCSSDSSEIEKLRTQLNKVTLELKVRDEEVGKLTRIREDGERELEDLTASLFQQTLPEHWSPVMKLSRSGRGLSFCLKELELEINEWSDSFDTEAHRMVREANEKAAAAEKALAESQMKVDVLTAEVTALKTLVLTSTPSRPNPHLHPQISNDPSTRNLFSRRHRRSPSHFNLKYGRENSPPESPVQSDVNIADAISLASETPSEVDPTLHKEIMTWRENPKLDKTDPFICRVYSEDIDLCLDFNNRNLAAAVRLAVESRDIYIEAVSDKTKTVFPKKCALLEVPRQCHYRMRLGDQETWHSISQICRNRIIAVCDFINYLRYIELGLVKSTAHDIYWEIIRLRKEMVLARLGLSLCSN